MIKINRLHGQTVHPLRSDYILLTSTADNELTIQVNDRGCYHEITFSGNYNSLSIDEISLNLFGFDSNRNIISFFDLRNPAAISIYRGTYRL